MAILTTLPNDRAMLFGGFACGTQASLIVIPQPKVEIDYCSCEFACDYIESALYSSVDKTVRNSDTTSILLELSTASSSFELKLINKSTSVETILNDDTYGQYFGQGDLQQPLKVGMIIDWELVGTGIGNATYQIEISVTNFGDTVTELSHLYRCAPYSDLVADGTVKIVTTNEGIIDGGVDYDGMSWNRSVRFEGKFGLPSFSLETTDYEDNSRNWNQNQDKISITYSLSTDILPSSVSNQLVLNDSLANQILIYDYNLANTEVFNGVEVRPVSIEEPEYFEQNPNGAYSFTFKPVGNKPVKRNKFI
jgi:hypothetical protein